MRPYVGPLLAALEAKLHDNNPRVRSYVLSTIGELARASGRDLCSHIDLIMNYIIDTLNGQVSIRKRQTAIRCLGQLARATGISILSLLSLSLCSNCFSNCACFCRFCDRSISQVSWITGLDSQRNEESSEYCLRNGADEIIGYSWCLGPRCL